MARHEPSACARTSSSFSRRWARVDEETDTSFRPRSGRAAAGPPHQVQTLEIKTSASRLSAASSSPHLVAMVKTPPLASACTAAAARHAGSRAAATCGPVHPILALRTKVRQPSRSQAARMASGTRRRLATTAGRVASAISVAIQDPAAVAYKDAKA